MDNILKHWPLLVALVYTSLAWGAQQQQIHALEDAIATQTTIQAQQADMRVQQAETKAQAKQAADQAKQNHDLLLQLLQRLGQ